MPDINRLQPFMRNSKIYQALFDTESSQIDARQVNINDLATQMFVDTATWGIAIYEKELGIITDLTQAYNERRSVIKSKMRGTGKVSAILIKIVADAYTDGDVDVTFANSTITVTYTSVFGIPPNEPNLEAIIEEIKPAHLAVVYVFLYIRYEQLNNHYTYGQMAARTYDELKTQLP